MVEVLLWGLFPFTFLGFYRFWTSRDLAHVHSLGWAGFLISPPLFPLTSLGRQPAAMQILWGWEFYFSVAFVFLNLTSEKSFLGFRRLIQLPPSQGACDSSSLASNINSWFWDCWTVRLGYHSITFKLCSFLELELSFSCIQASLCFEEEKINSEFLYI